MDMNQTMDAIQAKMEELLPPDRFKHTISVAYLAASLAMCYGVNPEKAMIAGLLHDNAKYLSYNTALLECNQANLTLSAVERNNPMLLHGKLGAYYARVKYGIEDEDILSAIASHTTGKPAMTVLEKIVFLADYIEVRRTQVTKPSLEVIRETAFHNLDLSVYYALDNTLRYLKRCHRLIDSSSEEALLYYKTKLQ